MATAVNNQMCNYAMADDSSSLNYVAVSTLVGIRSWTRRDRSAFGRWPQHQIPAHWAATGPVTPGMRISFAIDDLANTTLVGRISLREFSDNADSAKIGIFLHPDQCGKGFGSAALLALQRHLARENMRYLTLDVAQDNTRAVRSYLRAGWHVTGNLDREGMPYYEMRVQL